MCLMTAEVYIHIFSGRDDNVSVLRDACSGLGYGVGASVAVVLGTWQWSLRVGAR